MPAVFIEAAEAAIGDLPARVPVVRKGVTRRDYGRRHHGGYLGKKARGDNE